MWYKQHPELYEQIKSLLQSRFPTMHAEEYRGEVHIRGKFPVMAKDMVIDHYLLDIRLPDDYPKSVPVVKELESKIPKLPDRHVSSDGTLCLFLADEQWKHYSPSDTIVDFLAGPVNQFLLNQQHFDLTGQWLNGERGHGVNGVYEYYSEELATKDPKAIIELLQYLRMKNIKGHWICYCGSGKKLRHCHLSKVLDLRKKIPQKVASNSLVQIMLALGQLVNK